MSHLSLSGGQVAVSGGVASGGGGRDAHTGLPRS